MKLFKKLGLFSALFLALTVLNPFTTKAADANKIVLTQADFDAVTYQTGPKETDAYKIGYAPASLIVKPGYTVELQGDVSVNYVTIQRNETADGVLNATGGTVTVGQVENYGTITGGNYSFLSGNNILSHGGKFNGGTFTGLASGTNGSSGDFVVVSDSRATEVNGAVFTRKLVDYGYAVVVNSGAFQGGYEFGTGAANVVINGGTIGGAADASTSGYTAGITITGGTFKVPLNGKATISGGTFEEDVNGASYSTISGGTFKKSVYAPSSNISGGTFNGEARLQGCYSNPISGGTFNGMAYLDGAAVNNGTFNGTVQVNGTVINGGTFNNKASGQYVTINGGSFKEIEISSYLEINAPVKYTSITGEGSGFMMSIKNNFVAYGDCKVYRMQLNKNAYVTIPDGSKLTVNELTLFDNTELEIEGELSVDTFVAKYNAPETDYKSITLGLVDGYKMDVTTVQFWLSGPPITIDDNCLEVLSEKLTVEKRAKKVVAVEEEESPYALWSTGDADEKVLTMKGSTTVIAVIKETEEEMKIEYFSWFALPTNLCEEIQDAEKPATITYTYKGYKIVANIPAGKAIVTGEKWYGPEYFAYIYKDTGYLTVTDKDGEEVDVSVIWNPYK